MRLFGRLAVGVGVTAGLAGLLLATGVVSIRRGEPQADGPEVRDLGYLAQPVIAMDQDRLGLVRKTSDAEPGYAIYLPIGWVSKLRKAPLETPWNRVALVDLEGEEVHTWSIDALQPPPNEHTAVYPLDDGSILVVILREAIGRIDWHGNLMWRTDGPFHHDLDVDPQGNIIGMQRPHDELTLDGQTYPIFGQTLVVMDGTGRVQRVIDLHALFHEHPAVRQYIDKPELRTTKNKKRERLDLYHLNSVETLPADPQGRWQAGDLLISFRAIDLVAIVAGDGSAVRWDFDHNTLQGQHSPTLSSPDTILVFDNGMKRQKSRIVEIDLSAKAIVWQYEGDADNPFFSASRGMVTALQGGNVFVVDSNRGRMFEVDRNGTIVWEYFSPHRWNSRYVPIRGEKIQGQRYRSFRALLESGAPTP